MAAAGQAEGEAYADFLAIQHSARTPLERWADEICPADMVPPAQCAILAEDLASLGRPLPEPAGLEPPETVDWHGFAWALAGSSLGNRAMLVRRRKVSAGGPDRFLSDPAMPQYFRELLPTLARPATPEIEEGAIAAALAVFATFDEALHLHGERFAA